MNYYDNKLDKMLASLIFKQTERSKTNPRVSSSFKIGIKHSLNNFSSISIFVNYETEGKLIKLYILLSTISL
jgi:hypothetical protein